MMLRALTCLLVLILAGCAPVRPVQSLQRPLANTEFDRYVLVTLRNPQGPVVPRAGSTVRNYDFATSYAVSPATRANANAIAAAHGLREVTAWPIALLDVHCLVYELPLGVDRNEMIDRLRRDRRIETAQPLQTFSTLTSGSPDPYRRLQRNLDTMDVQGAHTASRGAGVRIAIIDTGIDETHPDLAGRIYRQENVVDERAVSQTHDRHGTAVAGVIAADDDNEVGIVGVAPEAQLHVLRACWPAPEDDSRALCSTLTLAKAIATAIEAHSDIINLSLTGPADPLLTRLVVTGQRRGIYFVGAVATAGRADNFPAGIPGVIGVYASGDQGSDTAVLYAPGHDILTLVPGGRYDFLSGSSLAAASVSGGIALLLARDRSLSAEQTRSILARSTRWVDTEHGPVASVDLCAALAMVVDDPRCSARATDTGKSPTTRPAAAGRVAEGTQANRTP
jgi:Subtilase family